MDNLRQVLNAYKPTITLEELAVCESHLDELQSAITNGIGAIGNFMFWVADIPEYEEKTLRQDIRKIGYLLSNLEHIADFAASEKQNLSFLRYNPDLMGKPLTIE